MRFTNVIAVLAILGLAVQANAYSGGTLRRAQTQTVAQNDVSNSANSEAQVVLIPSENTTVQAAPAAQTQPATVVEAQPVTESKAEMLRKARQNQEVQTEQKIVEKLEESRLREEQERAERLFGNKLDNTAPAAAAVAPAPVPAPAQAPQPAPAPQPQQVTIEKIEIVQPAVEKTEEVKPVETVKPLAEAPAGENTLDVSEEQESAPAKKIYVGGVLGVPTYSAGNMKTNYGLGFNVGTTLDANWSVEGGLLYSNHNVDTFWEYNIYREMEQYDIQALAKYSFLTGPLKPYAGAGAAYIYRKYSDRLKDPRLGYTYDYNASPESLDTHTVNLVLVAGVDYAINDKVTIGAGVDYNKPVMAQNKPNFVDYGLPENTKPVEEFDYYILKINAKMSF